MEREYDLFEVLSDGAHLWRQMVAGHDNAVRKLTELSKQTTHEIRVMHILSNTVIASMNGPKAWRHRVAHPKRASILHINSTGCQSRNALSRDGYGQRIN
jgi:prophage DNA circulation protein